MMKKGTKVVVTTAHRGVFFGTLAARDGSTVTLADARNCLYWDRSIRGFLGLAESGPSKGSRVGPSVGELELFDVTSITRCTPKAAEQWEKAPWSA